MEVSFYSIMLLLLMVSSLVTCNLIHNLSTDQSSLLVLKSQITSDPYNILTNNWTSQISVCSWIGVTCGPQHNRVIALSIPNMDLEGIIPPEIGNLSFLVSLNMSRNYFYGNLPMELARLRRLRVVDFYRNNITGELPKSWFGSLLKLEYLDIGSNSLQGMIPREIGNFSKLEVLVLEFNQLTGPVPTTIFNISTLEKVNLDGNSLTGSLPENICNSYNGYRLKLLHLAENMLEGEIPLSWCQCTQLQFLDLAFNKVNGSIPGDIGNMTALQILNLYRNNLTGIIPKRIGQLRNLKRVGIAENKIVGVIPQEISYLYELETVAMASNLLSGGIPLGIFNMSKLNTLDLAGNILSTTFLIGMSFNLPKLERLYLGGNELRGPILSLITNSSNLYILDLGYNNFGGSIPNTLGNNLRFLEILNLQGNNFSTIDASTSQELNFITSLTNCRYLRVLEFGKNNLDAILPPYIGNFSNSLQRIVANSCRLKGHIPAEIGNLSNLNTLFLFGNELVGFIPPALQGLQNIEQLVLHENKLTGYFPNSFCTFQNLGILSLTRNQFSGPIPECLGNVTTLRYLYLGHNKFNSTIPTYLWLLKELLVLDLSSNSLSGSLSPAIENLKELVIVDMSMNVLSGSIPTSIGSLVSLINMSLAHNRLQGPIPDSVSKMLSLERLDLSENNLSGVIPKSLETLQYFAYFNVSFNNLSGEIPSNGPFTNFTDQSFMFNNKDLCGAHRFGVLPCIANSVQTSRKKKKFNYKVVIMSLGAAMGIIITLVVLVLLMNYRKKNQSTPNVSLLLSPKRQRKISYYELQQATDGYNSNNLLGTGGFSSVYKGVLQDGTLLAVKVFNMEVQGSLQGFDAECEVLRNLRHRNLTKVICSCSNDDFKALVLDYMPNGTLYNWLYLDKYFLDIVQRLNIMLDVAFALEYLHHGYSTTVIHCDLKPSNILLNEDMVAHVSDFGMAKLLSKEDSATHTRSLASLGYMAPEYGMEGIVSPKCDIYSYGIMLMEVFTRTKPSDEIFYGELNMKTWVQNSLPNEVVQVVDSSLLDPNDEQQLKCLTSIMELAISCTAQSPRDRIAIKDVLSILGKLKYKLLQRH